MNPRQLRLVRAIAREKAMARYVYMECGHVTTREEIEFFSVWQEQRGVYYCTECHADRRKADSPQSKNVGA